MFRGKPAPTCAAHDAVVGARPYRRAEVFCCHRSRDKMTLRFIAFSAYQESQLFVSFHAFCNHPYVETVRHGNDRPYHRRSVRVSSRLLHKALIDLQPVDLILK